MPLMNNKQTCFNSSYSCKGSKYQHPLGHSPPTFSLSTMHTSPDFLNMILNKQMLSQNMFKFQQIIEAQNCAIITPSLQKIIASVLSFKKG